MASIPQKSGSVPNGVPPPYHHQRAKSASETQCEEARVVFDKTIAGHYRHGGKGYRNVGALFLTWEEDDMQCKDMEVRTSLLLQVRIVAHV